MIKSCICRTSKLGDFLEKVESVEVPAVFNAAEDLTPSSLRHTVVGDQPDARSHQAPEITNHTDFLIIKTSTFYYLANMTLIKEAIAAIKSLELGDSINYTKIAEEFGVSRSTLSRHYRGV